MSGGEWVSSALFCKAHAINRKTLEKSCKRAHEKGKNFCVVKSIKIDFLYLTGCQGGDGGRVLQIWSQPLTPLEVEALEASSKEGVKELPSLEEIPPSIKESTPASPPPLKESEAVAGAGESLPFETSPLKGSESPRKSSSLAPTTPPSATPDSQGTGLEARGFPLSKGHDLPSDPSLSATELEARESPPSATPTPARSHAVERGVGRFSPSATPSLPLSKGEETPLLDSALRGSSDATEAILSEIKGLKGLAGLSIKARQKTLKREAIVREWQRARRFGVGAEAFATLASKQYGLKLTTPTLYRWSRDYEAMGLAGLVDTRGGRSLSLIATLGLEERAKELILGQRGRINVSNIHRALNYYAALDLGLLEPRALLGKEEEAISYEVVHRYVKRFLEKNRLAKELIHFGEDGVVGRNLPALGKSNWAVDSINQIVEIDASPLDLITQGTPPPGVDPGGLAAWQERYCVIGLVDTYSGVCTLHISRREDSLGIARAVAKYIRRYGVPKVIKGDNGKAFLSKYTQGVMENLGIEYRRVRAYSGWLKPYVERNFRTIQHQFIEWIEGYIGHNVSERQAIEFFASKKERRLKRGQKSQLQELESLSSLEARLDAYLEKVLANSYREGGTPKALYDAKVSEAVAMSDLELTLRLSPLELRRVGKKGISLNGLLYYLPSMFAYDSLYVAPHINNIHEAFLFDPQKEFIGIAQTLSSEEVSAEEAKAAQQAFRKRLKRAKAEVAQARSASEANLKRLYSALERSLEAPQAPQVQTTPKEEAIQIAQNQAKALRTTSIEEALLEAKREESKKRDYSFEGVVLGA